MQICIPFESNEKGGPYQFAQKFRKSLNDADVKCTDNIRDAYDILFIISSWNPKQVRTAKMKGAKVVQRLDGVYYPAVSGPLYFLKNRDIKKIYRDLADFVVFQSEYSKFLVNRFLGGSNSPHTTIYNGYDPKRFSPGPSGKKSNRTVLTVNSVYRRPSTILPIINTAKEIKDVRFKIIGRVSRLAQRAFPDNLPENVEMLGEVPNETLASYYQQASALMYINHSPCPNVVIEALACGLPVVGYDIGSTKELIGDAGVLADHPNPFYYARFIPDHKGLVAGLETVFGKQKSFRDKAIARSKKFTIEHMTKKYIDIFKSLL